MCEVTRPTGSVFPALLLDHFMTHGGSPKWIAVYPDDFKWVRTRKNAWVGKTPPGRAPPIRGMHRGLHAPSPPGIRDTYDSHG